MTKKLLVLCTILICIISILVPGKLLIDRSKQNIGTATVVPEKLYSAANMSMAKKASEKLETSEKVQLITGEWESVTYPKAETEATYAAFQAASMAADSMDRLYRDDLYAYSVKSDYANWYSWSADCYKVVDSIFHTYTVYYWVITYERYDHTEKHTISIIEDGTIFKIDGEKDGKTYNYTYK